MSLSIKNVQTSTQAKPLISIDGKFFDPNKLIEVVQRAKGMPDTATYSEDVPEVTPDASADDAGTPKSKTTAKAATATS